MMRAIPYVTRLLFAALQVGAAATVPAWAQVHTLRTADSVLQVETVASGLEHPWGLAQLPDGNLLVTERPGRLRLVSPDGRLSPPLSGVPNVFAEGQGGLLDIALAPDFATSRLVYLAFAEAGRDGAGTALARARLAESNDALTDLKVIFRQEPKVPGPNHFGARIVFRPDGTLFLTLGERFKFQPAQDPRSDLGKIVRLGPDGTVPSDNPFAGRKEMRPEIFSLGHRNIQGAALHPQTGRLWVAEMGPRGGDEINIVEAGKNYGWPKVSWGTHYDGRPIPLPPSHPQFADAIHHWTPSIAPSGMAFYAGDAFPAWNGNLLVGALAGQSLMRLTLDGDKVAGEERIPIGFRVRDVRVAPDGAILLLTDENDGAILRLTPARN
ncbi:PQQ-dependent sugar dehydrogenase [Blastochloris tepida]|uniref:Dehydrogenase n=1 Tax=Blastochloris tepida TaxID=2233851 RepID=A0A348FX58_9HYPH|nr:PQQ-dependent sugar dehydrogenase [Blastochloris tepida]BBF91891.1 dehydrogenase [Blastochloris tepida]